MPNRKYTNRNRHDASQAAGRPAARLFRRELGEIMAGGKSSTAAGPAAPVQAMRKEGDGRISKIDLTAQIDNLQAALRTTRRGMNTLAKKIRPADPQRHT